jgi:hypothetical protein
MVNYKLRFTPETQRTVAGPVFSDMLYHNIGTPIAHPSRMLIFVNNTGILLFISWDGVHDHLALLPGATLILDETSNAVSQAELITVALTQFAARAPAGVAGTDNLYLSTFFAN